MELRDCNILEMKKGWELNLTYQMEDDCKCYTLLKDKSSHLKFYIYFKIQISQFRI